MNENLVMNTTPQPSSSFGARLVRVLKRTGKTLGTLMWPQQTSGDLYYTDHEVSALFVALSGTGEGCVDAQTWRDLDLKQYCARLTPGFSLLGQQGVHLRLRQGGGHREVAAARYRTLADDAPMRSTLLNMFAPLRRLEFDVSSFVFSDVRVDAPWWGKALLPFQILLLIAMAAPIYSLALLWPVGILVLIAFLVQASWLTRVERFDEKLLALRAILDVGCELSQLAKAQPTPILAAFLDEIEKIKQVKNDITRSVFETATPGARLYADWFFLNNIRHHFKAAKKIRENQLLLRRWYLLLANLEADLVVAQHIATQSHFCWADISTGNQVALTALVNPLLADAAPVSFATDGTSVFLSGQNGSGKSTFLRTLGLNMVVGRAFGFCYAAKATIPFRPTYTSIQIEDSMADGESLYVAELKRAKALLDSSHGPHAGIYIVDEIFRGTNHVESVSAAAALINELAQNALVVVSSHNLILAPLLKRQLTPMVVTTNAGGVAIQPGILEQPNGIALLATTGFDQRISSNAAKVATWLSSYLAHPEDCPDLLQ